MRTYRRLFQIFFLALILGSASGCAMFQPDDPGYNNPQRAQNIVRTASSQEGKQYRMGGASPSRGFDCSGLIWWAYRQNGLKVPRVTVDQARAGYAVPKSSPRPGDIMVFRTSSGPRGLHTGIYAGNNTFIHSPSRGKTVRRENMQPYWGNRLIAVRRIVIGSLCRKGRKKRGRPRFFCAFFPDIRSDRPPFPAYRPFSSAGAGAGILPSGVF